MSDGQQNLVILLSGGKTTCPGLTDKWNFEPCPLNITLLTPTPRCVHCQPVSVTSLSLTIFLNYVLISFQSSPLDHNNYIPCSGLKKKIVSPERRPFVLLNHPPLCCAFRQPRHDAAELRRRISVRLRATHTRHSVVGEETTPPHPAGGPGGVSLREGSSGAPQGSDPARPVS